MEWESVATQPTAGHGAGSPPAASSAEPPAHEPTILDILVADTRHTMALFDHFTVAVQQVGREGASNQETTFAHPEQTCGCTPNLSLSFALALAQGNAHSMDLLAAALAVDLRLHTAAEALVVAPLVRRRTLPGAAQSGDAETLLQRMERKRLALEQDQLEILTCRREGDYAQLAAAVRVAHQDFAARAAEQRRCVLPLLAPLPAPLLRGAAAEAHRAKAAAQLAPPSIPESAVAVHAPMVQPEPAAGEGKAVWLLPPTRPAHHASLPNAIQEP